jgi:hypothetical protein
VRPEDLELTALDGSDTLAGEVTKVGFHGAYLEVMLHCAQGGVAPFDVTVWHQGPFMVYPGEIWGIHPRP